MKDTLRLLACAWATGLFILSSIATLGLLVWPWADRPLACLGVGVVGLAISTFCAWVVTRTIK